MSDQNMLHWRLQLKTGDTVLWYPHGIVNLVDRPVPGTWRVTGAALVGIVSAPERDLQPMPGHIAPVTKRTDLVDEAVQPMPDVDADVEPEPPVVRAIPESQPPSPVGGPAESEAATAPSFVLSIAAIRMDGGTQARAGLNWDTINDYADLMAEGVEFPPVIVCFDGAEYWLSDGFHRVEAAKRTGAADIRAEVRPGDARTARLHAAGANGDHGLPRTNNDKRRAVLLLLNDPEWARWSDREIARRCAVSDRLVNKVRAELTANGSQSPAVRTGADGRTINTAGISASNTERAAKPAAAAEADYVHVYKTGERAGVSDVVKHYRPGCGGVVASVDQPDGVRVEWHKWDGNAQVPPFDVSSPQSARDFSLVRRGYEEAATPVAAPVRPAHISEDGEITAGAEDATQVVPRVAQPAMSAREALHSSQSNEWYTPARYIEAAREVMGGIDLDPASCEAANETVKADRFFSIADDGLAQKWGGRVWLNPPYGKEDGESNQARWAAKLIAEFEVGRVSQAVMLVNAVTDREWFQRLWDFPICFTHHRIRFINAAGEQQDSPTNGNAFIYLSADDDGVQEFAERFREFGPVVTEVWR